MIVRHLVYRKIARIFVVEDDDDDYFLIEKCIRALSQSFRVQRFHDGEELMEFFYKPEHCGVHFSDIRPDVIFLDINMPRKDGWETLMDLQLNRRFKDMAIVVLTTSDIGDEKAHGFALGAKAVFQKPTGYAKWLEIFKHVERQWINTGIPETDRGSS